MKINFLLLLSLFLASSLHGQADSIKALLATEIPDSIRAKALNDLAFSIHYYDAESCLTAAQEAANLASQLNLQREETRAYYHQLLAHYVMERFEEGIKAGEIALELATIHKQWRLKFDIHQSLSTLRREIDDVVRSLEDADQMIAIAEELDDEQMLNTAEMNLADLYLVQGNRTLAKSIIEDVVDRRINQKDTIGLAGVYGFLADLEIDIDKRAAILNRALNLAESGRSLFDKINLNWIYGNFLRKDRSDLEGAIKHYRRALKMASNIQEPFYSMVSAHSIGSSYAELEQIDSARYYYDFASSIGPTRNTLSHHIQILRDKSQLEYEEGNTDQAYSYQQEAMLLSDSLYKQERQKLVTDAQTRYDLSQKEDQILAAQLEAANQQSSKQKLLIAGLLILFSLVIGFQYYRSIQRKRKQAIEQRLIREKAESDRLRELDEMKTQFFTNVSHELRTPLTLITSPLEESLKELKQVGIKSKLQTAHRNSQKLLGLTNEILDLAKLEAGQLSLEVDSFFVLPQVERLLAAFSSKAEIQEVDLQLQSETETSLPILADLKSFETIFNNLLANALKFTPVGGSIIVKLSNAHEKFQLSITDSGSGIHPEDQPHIFDRFYQSRHQSHAEGGTGIGLSLSKRLAELMQGALTVKSELEKGSQFTLTLPIGNLEQANAGLNNSKAPVSTIAVDKNPNSAHNHPVINLGSLPKLLIVEDNADLANYIVSSLSPYYHCTLANNGKVALDLLNEQAFDIITSDVMMPEMDGFEFRNQLNKKETWRRIPFLMLTARALEEDKLLGFKLGVDDYVTKPFSIPELIARLSSLLKNRKGREEEWQNEPVSSHAEQFLTGVKSYVLTHLDDPSWGVEDVAKAMNCSQRHLARQIGPLTGMSPVQLILEIRLQEAYRMLKQERYTAVSEVQYAVGIESASYFSRKFKARFGTSPGELKE